MIYFIFYNYSVAHISYKKWNYENIKFNHAEPFRVHAEFAKRTEKSAKIELLIRCDLHV
jgi:hypothetical protein